VGTVAIETGWVAGKFEIVTAENVTACDAGKFEIVTAENVTACVVGKFPIVTVPITVVTDGA
jgi:hypothetical protein